jgi:AraC-like ligand binding domain
MARYATAHLDDLEAIPGPGSLTWRPVRAHFDIRAFGTNAYTAREAGEDVVEPHTESPTLAHQELYFVARGRATFRLDDEEIDAPAGTYVFVPDPAVHRHAVAAEPGTTVLSFGGPPTFTPSPWEWTFRASALADSDPARAREVVDDGLRTHPEALALHLWHAKLDAREGRRDDARAEVRAAIAARPDLEQVVREDADLAPLLDAGR